MKILPRTPFDLPILIFLFSGFIGYRASYDPAASLPKFLLLVGSVLVYYAIVSLRHARKRLDLAVWFYILCGATASVYFIAQTNFDVSPTKSEILTRLGVGLNAILPRLTNQTPHPNIVAGVLEIVLPFAVLLTLELLKRRLWLAAMAGICTVLIVSGLMLTTSRGAWLAIGTVLSCLVVVRLVWMLLRRTPLAVRRPLLLDSCLALFLALVVLGKFHFGNLLDPLGMDGDVRSRFELYRQTWELVQEYPFTGAGLGVFPLVFSAYVLLVDAPFYAHAHNVFLAIWIEQGILGIAALVWLWIEFARWSWGNRKTWNWLTTAGFVAACIWLLHGLVDNPIYGSRALPLLFAPFAFALASVEYDSQAVVPRQSRSQRGRNRISRIGFAVACIAVGLLLVARWNQWAGMFYANLGAVLQTKAELALYRFDKPPIEIHSIMEIRQSLATGSALPQDLFRTALAYDASNAAAQRRLGLIALSSRNFDEAVRHLETAWQLDPDSRATRKGLGYAFAWRGDVNQAQQLLQPLPETPLELSDDIWWWRLRNRPDLAENAQRALHLIAAAEIGGSR